MDTNAGRNMVINEYNKWYYFAYVIKGCDIDCYDIHEAIENLEKHVKSIYTNDNVIDISNFEHMSEYDALAECSLYFICDTDTIKWVKING